MNSKSQFRVLAGTLLHDPVNRDVKYMLTPQRLADQGDDLALRHLANNPRAVDYFEKPLPANLDELIEDYRKRHGDPAPAAVSEQEAQKADEKAAQPANTGRGGRRNTATAEKAEKSAAPAEPAAVSEQEAQKAVSDDATKNAEEYDEVPSGVR